jgi:nicotinamide riboside kinase
LAEHYKSAWVAEYAREYIGQLNRPYLLEDIEIIAKKQLEQEQTAARNCKSILFCDTELLVTKIWAKHNFNSTLPWIEKNIEQNPFDLYLLSDIDLPWEPDPQREHPDKRKFFFDWFQAELEKYKFNYRIVSGENSNRLRNAIQIIDGFLAKAESPS